MDYEKVINAYIKWRDQKKELEEKHKQELAPLRENMEKAEAALQKVMLDSNCKKISTKAGTAYLSEQVSTKVTDWDEVINFVQSENRYDILERRVNKTVAKEEEIPGVAVTRRMKTNIRVS